MKAALLIFVLVFGVTAVKAQEIPAGRLGQPLGMYLTIEGVRAEKGMKVGVNTLLVDTLIAENHTRDRLKKLFPAAGIKTGRRLHWHSWRNHFVLRCLNAGIAVHHVMRWTGHDSVGMVLHYAEAKTSYQTGFAEFGKLPTSSLSDLDFCPPQTLCRQAASLQTVSFSRAHTQAVLALFRPNADDFC